MRIDGIYRGTVMCVVRETFVDSGSLTCRTPPSFEATYVRPRQTIPNITAVTETNYCQTQNVHFFTIAHFISLSVYWNLLEVMLDS